MINNRITTGGDIDSYCTRCRLNLEHIIVAMVGGAVVKVKCKTCGSTHKFRDLSGSKPRSARPAASARQRGVASQAVWESALEGASVSEQSYDMSSAYKTGDVIVHSIFGKGVVQKTLFKKCAVLFRDGEKVLASSNT